MRFSKLLPTSYRLGAETKALIRRLQVALPDDLGRKRSATDIIKLALQDLAQLANVPILVHQDISPED